MSAAPKAIPDFIQMFLVLYHLFHINQQGDASFPFI